MRHLRYNCLFVRPFPRAGCFVVCLLCTIEIDQTMDLWRGVQLHDVPWAGIHRQTHGTQTKDPVFSSPLQIASNSEKEYLSNIPNLFNLKKTQHLFSGNTYVYGNVIKLQQQQCIFRMIVLTWDNSSVISKINSLIIIIRISLELNTIT